MQCNAYALNLIINSMQEQFMYCNLGPQAEFLSIWESIFVRATYYSTFDVMSRIYNHYVKLIFKITYP